jgi:hypothetical protein
MNLRCLNPQFFIASRVGDVALEHDAWRGARADEQLGILIEAVRVISTAVPADGLLPADRLALERLNALRRPGDPRAAAADAVITTADIDDLIAKLRRLRHEDPDSANRIVRRLVEEAGPPAPSVMD